MDILIFMLYTPATKCFGLSGMYIQNRTRMAMQTLDLIFYLRPGTPELGGGGGRRGSCPPCLLLGGARGAKVPFKYKEYYINSFRGTFS